MIKNKMCTSKKKFQNTTSYAFMTHEGVNNNIVLKSENIR